MRPTRGNSMKEPLPPLMDLVELKKDILDKHPSAALPCQLSDFWLDRIADSLAQVLENPCDESRGYLAGPLALVAHLLFARSSSSELEVSQLHLYEYLRAYRVEVALEVMNRRTDLRATSASLETIFTDRPLTSSYAYPK